MVEGIVDVGKIEGAAVGMGNIWSVSLVGVRNSRV
jgi:hypothetical protein